MAQQSFTCEICSASFVSEDLLADHEEQVHADSEGRFVCQFCQERFRSDDALQAHFEERHGGEAPDSLPCPECGIAFADDALLEEHMAQAHPHFPGMTRGS